MNKLKYITPSSEPKNIVLRPQKNPSLMPNALQLNPEQQVSLNRPKRDRSLSVHRARDNRFFDQENRSGVTILGLLSIQNDPVAKDPLSDAETASLSDDLSPRAFRSP